MNIIERATAIGIETLLHFEEADRLCDLACNRDVLELGSYKGGSAWAMASTAKSLTCVDPFQADETAQRQAGVSTTLEDFLRAISRFTNVSFLQMTSEEAARVLEGRTFDMIFIDAMHDNCAEDIRLWWPRVKSGGVLVVHDVGHGAFPQVAVAMDEAFGPPPEGSMVQTLRWVDKP